MTKLLANGDIDLTRDSQRRVQHSHSYKRKFKIRKQPILESIDKVPMNINVKLLDAHSPKGQMNKEH